MSVVQLAKFICQKIAVGGSATHGFRALSIAAGIPSSLATFPVKTSKIKVIANAQH